MKTHISLALATIFSLAFTVVSGSAAAAPATVTHGLRLHEHLRNGTSTNWSGYAVATALKTPASNAVSAVSGKWVVPTVSCPSLTSSYSSNWVGIDGYSDSTVEQTGTEQDCRHGRAQYYAWYEFYPQSESLIGSMVVHPGDVMSGGVSYTGNGNFAVTITDQTANSSFSLTRWMGNAQRQSAEWIAEAPSSWFGVLPLANFGTTSFTSASATLNGHTGSIADPAWQNDPLSMVTAGGQSKAAVSGLSSDGTGFSVTWHHS